MSSTLTSSGRTATATYKMVTVQSHRSVSDHAAARLGIRHETPQAILLRDGRPVWSASHFRITADALGQRQRSTGLTLRRRLFPASSGHSHAAPRTPLESPCCARTSRVSTRSENTNRFHSRGTAS